MSGHTPGPWKTDGSAIFAEPGNVVAVAINEDCEFGFISRVFGRDEQEANARLIAAAPEMLEAVRAVQRGLRDGSIKWAKPRQSDSDPYHPANTLMCAAVAKAEGESE